MAAQRPRQIRTSEFGDDRLRALAGRVVSLEHFRDALSRMPDAMRELVDKHEERTRDQIDANQREMRAMFERHRDQTREDLRAQHADVKEELRNLPKPLTFWKHTAAILLALSPFELAAAAYLISHL